MTNKEAVNLIDIIRMGYICDPHECGAENARELCDIFKCDDFHEACVMAIEALEAQDHKCENCDSMERLGNCVTWGIPVEPHMSCKLWEEK